MHGVPGRVKRTLADTYRRRPRALARLAIARSSIPCTRHALDAIEQTRRPDVTVIVCPPPLPHSLSLFFLVPQHCCCARLLVAPTCSFEMRH
ncbi:hypothetical protein MTO96_009705 [Rhipicephalus appendiculatus]